MQALRAAAARVVDAAAAPAELAQDAAGGERGPRICRPDARECRRDRGKGGEQAGEHLSQRYTRRFRPGLRMIRAAAERPHNRIEAYDPG